MLGFFTTKVLAYICAALGIAVLGLSVALWAAGVRIDDVKNQRDAAELRVKEALKTIDGQKAVLAECSARTDALKAEGVKRQAEADKAVSDARKEAARYQQANQKRDAALKAPTPQGAGCREALVGLRGELRK